MVNRPRRGSLLQELGPLNPWWSHQKWGEGDPQLQAVSGAPYHWRSSILDDVAPPNLYTLRGPRRVGKSTVLKQTILRLIAGGIDPRRILYFAADSVDTYRDLINVFQVTRQLFPDLGDTPRYFLIDEVTAVPQWERAVKWARDNTAMAGDCVVATGSSAADVATGAYHLAGRRGPDADIDRLLLPMAFPTFATSAGYGLPPAPRLSLPQFFTDDGRKQCQDALVHLGTLVNAFEAYLTIGGFPQAVTGFRRTATVPDGFARDLWDVIQADLGRAGVSRPEHCLSLLALIVESIRSAASMQTLADRLDLDRRTAISWIEALASTYLILILFQESGGAPDVNSMRKLYPTDPFIAMLPSRRALSVEPPDLTRLSEAAIAMALFRSVESNAIDHFHRPGHLFYYRSAHNKEVDFLALPGRYALESKYIDTPDRRELRAMQENFGDGLLLSRSAVDVQANGAILPASIFCWLLDQGD